MISFFLYEKVEIKERNDKSQWKHIFEELFDFNPPEIKVSCQCKKYRLRHFSSIFKKLSFSRLENKRQKSLLDSINNVAGYIIYFKM